MSATRTVTAVLGPTNTGKTHYAIERMLGHRTGVIGLPLRLLAREVYDRIIKTRGPSVVALVTGEERIVPDRAQYWVCTVEAMPLDIGADFVAVDEIQLCADPERGHVFTDRLLRARGLHETLFLGAETMRPAIAGLIPGVQFMKRERFSELTYTGSKKISRMPERSAIVGFSVENVYAIAELIRRTKGGCAVVMGALSPRTRNAQVALYQNGDVDYLVATDAIGMGLNLPIRRVLFSTMTKFDGVGDRPLNESEVHQIAGRAGRYGLHEEGFTGVLHEAEPGAGRALKELLPRSPRAPRNFKAPVAPNWWHISTISQRLGKTRLHEILSVFMEQLKLDNAHFEVAELEQMLDLAAELDRNAVSLPLRDRFVYAQAPVDTRTESLVQDFYSWAWEHARSGQVGRPGFLDGVGAHSRLDRMEQVLRACTLWLWLDLRFPGVYCSQDEVVALRAELNDGIERQLKAKKPLWQARTRRSGGPRH